MAISDVIMMQEFFTKASLASGKVSKNFSSQDGSVKIEVCLYLNDVGPDVGLTLELLLCPDQFLQMSLTLGLTNPNNNERHRLRTDNYYYTKNEVKSLSKFISYDKAIKNLHNGTLFVYFDAFALTNKLSQFSLRTSFNAASIKFVENELTWKVCSIEQFTGGPGVALVSSVFPSNITDVAQFQLYLYLRGHNDDNANLTYACSYLTKQSRHLMPLVVNHKLELVSNVIKHPFVLFQSQNDSYESNSQTCSGDYSGVRFEKAISKIKNQCWTLTYNVKYSWQIEKLDVI